MHANSNNHESRGMQSGKMKPIDRHGVSVTMMSISCTHHSKRVHDMHVVNIKHVILLESCHIVPPSLTAF
eukprot:m.334292 g.334292  ORF g.334292 m.334292 type:complete len:70 (-) comp16070_c0_seq2:362-571(-)